VSAAAAAAPERARRSPRPWVGAGRLGQGKKLRRLGAHLLCLAI